MTSENSAVNAEAVAPADFDALVARGINPRFAVALGTLMLFASLVLFPPVHLPLRPVAGLITSGTRTIPAPAQLAQKFQTVMVPAPAGAGVKGARPAKRPPVVIDVPDEVSGDTLVHVAWPGESFTSLSRTYLAHTTYMLTADLEDAIHKANPELGRTLRPGDRLVVPGYESAPIDERPAPMQKDAEVRAIYLTGLMAGSRHGLELIRSWKSLGGNSIVFDIKDSDGSVSVPFENPLTLERHHHYIENLPKFARFLHSQGLHGIARIAVFRDEELVVNHPSMAVQSRQSGKAWRENGKLVWTDPSRPEVQDYDIALAKLAAKSGIDEIQFDYIRFPAEGDQKDAQFYFQKAHPDWQRSTVIANFLARAYSELHPLGVLLSVDVFGVMAWQRPVDLSHTGQDIAAMARHCDILSPMIYPSHFFGMDGYRNPGDAPEHFISESMDRFQEITTGTGVVLRPWLQAFGWRTKTYSAGYIIKQVDVSNDYDGVGYMFWNARNDYSKPFSAMPELRAAQARPPRPPAVHHSHSREGKPAPPSSTALNP